MLAWFRALMPREDRFFDLFERHAATLTDGAAALRSLLDGTQAVSAAYAAIGNDGIWTTPHIVSSTVDAQGSTEVAGIETRSVVSPETAALMRELLAGVVERGTGQNGQVDGYLVGGASLDSRKFLAILGAMR